MSELKASNFINSVGILLSGTVVAQLLNVAFIPIITRIYTPEELGELGYYLRIVTFFAALVTMRLELALLSEKQINHRAAIMKFTVRWSMFLSFLLLVPLLIYFFVIKPDEIELWMLFFIPVGVALHALFNIGTHWELASEKFRSISIARASQAVLVNSFKVGFGYMSYGALGLIISVISGLTLSLLVYLKGFAQLLNKNVPAVGSPRTKLLLKKHRDLYLFNLPHVVVDLFRDVILATLILYLFTDKEYGYFDHSFRVLKLPVAFIGAAIGQVLFTRASKRTMNEEKLSEWAGKIVIGLAALSILPFILIYLFGPQIFSFAFGDNWYEAGQLSSIMTWWLMLNFIVSPMAYLPVVLNKQRSFFVLNLIGTALLILSVYIPVTWLEIKDFREVIGVVSLVQVFYNLLLLIYFVIIVKQYDRKIV